MSNIVMYTAYDNDDSYYDGKTWGKEIDIADKEYRMLVEKCFEHSSCFSLVFRSIGDKMTFPIKLVYDNQNDYQKYDSFIIKSGKTHKWPGTPGTGFGGIIRYYRCCVETLEMIYSISDSIFKFIYEAEDYNPEDLCFYRKDGSVLFASQVHEGRCWLFPKQGEDFANVLKAIPWFKSEYPSEDYDKYYNNLAVFMEKEDFLK